jgi:hypothetical protein
MRKERSSRGLRWDRGSFSRPDEAETVDPDPETVMAH